MKRVDYSRFYTPPQIAEALVKHINIESPGSVIDICCGSCNLLYAARKKWPNTKLVGVDIVNHNLSDISFTMSDGRKYATEHKGEYSLVLANPPFSYLEKRTEFPLLLNSVSAHYKTSRLENEMLLANLLLLNEKGILVIIMPSTFIESNSNVLLRKHIGTKYHIKKIIHLPDDTFGTSGIKSYALVISKCNSKKRFSFFYKMSEDDTSFIKIACIPQTDIKEGKWCAQSHKNESNSLFIDCRRGNISSQDFSDNGVPVLHTSKVDNGWSPSVRHTYKVPSSPVFAEAGDIIVSRVGKSAGQWVLYGGEKIYISDCLYRIKDPDGKIAKKICGSTYALDTRGVATQYITVSDFSFWCETLITNQGIYDEFLPDK